jgi:RimJ/RimL family protein N-acetyltransferase
MPWSPDGTSRTIDWWRDAGLRWLGGPVTASEPPTGPFPDRPFPDGPFPDCVPVLGDGPLVLRAHTVADAPRIVEQCVDPESVRWTTVPSPYALADAEGFVAEIRRSWESGDGPFYWAIADVRDPDTFLGTVDVRPQGAGIAKIGFGLHPQGRGRHLMSGAVRVVTRWWFEQGGTRMVWDAVRGNFGSWRVAHSCGFAFHATLPGQMPHRGAVLDTWTAGVGPGDDLTRPVRPWRDPVPLEGSGIRLREWRESDVEAVEPGDSPSHFMPGGAEPTVPTFDAWLLRRREQMALGEATHWCITDAAGDRALGTCVLIDREQEEGSAEVGYALFPSARGRGAATRALSLVVGHAFRAEREGGRGLRRLTALTVGDNEASARVLERAGFTEWGREPQFCFRSDRSLDDARHWVLVP